MERKARYARKEKRLLCVVCAFAFNVDRNRNESASIGQTDLRQVQDCAAPRRRAGDLFEPETQTEAGVIGELVQG
jgi:hypothetical protein